MNWKKILADQAGSGPMMMMMETHHHHGCSSIEGGSSWIEVDRAGSESNRTISEQIRIGWRASRQITADHGP